MLLDLGQHCSLRESFLGYASMARIEVLPPESSLPRCIGLIVPATVRIPPTAVTMITACLHGGGRVILESGVGFASAVDFAAHRAILREVLGVHIDSPVDLWPRHHASAIPYVDFTWPFATKVRDFSRVVPVVSDAGEVIARVRDLPVALKRRRGRGDLLVLGSPLGPVLWAGDAEAKRWFGAVLAI